MRMRRHIRPGFTLIELLIVVAIIAILAAIAVPNFLEAQVRAKVSASKTDMRTLATALESYAVDHTDYPHSAFTNSEANVKIYGFNPLIVLTTPVAYITSLPERNPFGPWDEGFNLPNELIDGYQYEGGQHFLNGNLPYYISSGYLPESLKELKYYIRGVGPSKENSLSASGIRILAYDASNGTRSTGDIWYFHSSAWEIRWD